MTPAQPTPGPARRAAGSHPTGAAAGDDGRRPDAPAANPEATMTVYLLCFAEQCAHVLADTHATR